MKSRRNITICVPACFAYAHINLLSMVLKFNPKDAPRVATDCLYIEPKNIPDNVVPDESAQSGQWRIKKEEMKPYKTNLYYTYQQQGENEHFPTVLPSIADPITCHRFSYLHGAGGSGKTTRVINTFKTGLKILTPTHRLERELISEGHDAQTYHSFFRYDGSKWVPEAIKDIPPVILWDEICTVPLEMLKEFVEFLRGKAQVIFVGDPCSHHQ